MDASRRWCRRCGSALSRYNREVLCAACSRAPTVVPASLWELAPIRQALGADDVGGVLVAARTALGLSQAGLAGLLSDESVAFSQAKLSRIEAGLAVKDIDDLRRISDVLGIPAELLGLASGRSFARASLALRPRVKVAAGRLAEQAGWLSFDAGRQDQARYYLTEAWTAARTADDADLELLALGSLSLQASRLGRLREAVAFAQRVQESPAARRTPVAV